MNNDIKKLADKFLDGLTTVEEELRLADYFRSHPHESGFEDMARLFTLFDTGMPIEGVPDVGPIKTDNQALAQKSFMRVAVWIAGMAAVVLALFLIGFPPLSDDNEQPVVAEMHNDYKYEEMADTISKDTIKKVQSEKTPPRRRKIRSFPPVPRIYMAHKAEAKSDSETSSLADSIIEQRLLQQAAMQKLMAEQVEKVMNARADTIDCVAEFLAGIMVEEVESEECW